MQLLIKNGRVIDPAQKRDEVTDILVENGKIVKVEVFRQDNLVCRPLFKDPRLGGCLVLPPSANGCKFSSARFTIPNDGASPIPHQKALRITGANSGGVVDVFTETVRPFIKLPLLVVIIIAPLAPL